METRLMVLYRLSLDGDEFRLVSKALRGLLTDDEKPAALELQAKMLREKHKQITNMLKESQKAMDHIEEAENQSSMAGTWLRVGGKSFRCACDCVTFHRYDQLPTHYRCDNCGRAYEGEPYDDK